ncbi:MAG: hypothetical protein WCJ30_14525, partial [Deltaproteobacteria bacterium]
ALGLLEPFLDDRPDAWVLVAAATHALGAVDDARTFLAQARTRADKGGFFSPHRRVLLGTLATALSVYGPQPMPGRGTAGVVAALVARAAWLHDARAELLDASLVSAMVTNLLRAGRTAGIEALLEPRAEAILPGIHAVVRAALSAAGVVLTDDGESEPVFVSLEDAPWAELFVAMLAAHPRMDVAWLGAGDARLLAGPLDEAARATLRSALGAPSGPARKGVVCARLVRDRVAALAVCFPRARFVRVDATGDAPGASDPAWHHVSFTAVLSDPCGEIDRLLAFLGEAPDKGPVRVLVDRYPGAAFATGADATPGERAHPVVRAAHA